MSAEPSPTVDLERVVSTNELGTETSTFAHIPSDSHVSIGGDLSVDKIFDRFQESTRQLLRNRLIIAALILLSMMGAVMLLVAVFGTPDLREVLTRTTAMAAMVSVFFLLRRDPDIGLKSLRRLELAMVAIPMLEALAAQVLETNKLLATEQYSSVPIFHANINVAVAIFIAIYGMLIPSNWRRTLSITLVIAILPMLVAFAHSKIDPRLSVLNVPNAATSSLLVMMSIIATLGAHVVHGIRREFETAKQYGQYELTDEIGRGGMGVVYKAQHQLLKRPAAIKLIRADAANDRTAIGRFEQEVQVSATLSHWNTVHIYDYGRTDDGDFFYVMEYLEGESLSQRLAESGTLDVATTVNLVKQLCDGLDEAHHRGMVHRDLKPGNVFLAKTGGRDDVVKILDFGLALMTAENEDQRVSTCGSPPYMSPEQIRGEDIDGRSDIYAIGCVLYECLIGEKLFNADSIKDLLNVHLTELPDLTQIPTELVWIRPIIERCLRKDKNERFESVMELRDVLTQSFASAHRRMLLPVEVSASEPEPQTG